MAGASGAFKASDQNLSTAAPLLKPPPQLARAAAGSSPGPLTGATVNGSMLDQANNPGNNLWDSAVDGGVYVPPGYGNSAPVTPPDNIPINDSVVEFG